jgi:hypothetical protein
MLPGKKDENVVNMILTQKWREYLLDNEKLHANEETALKKMTSCNKIIQLTRQTNYVQGNMGGGRIRITSIVLE